VDEEHVIKGDVAVIVLYSDGMINNVGFTLSYEVTADGMKYFGEHFVLQSNSTLYWGLWRDRLLYENNELSTVLHTAFPGLGTKSNFSAHFESECMNDYMLACEFVSDRPMPYWNVTERFVLVSWRDLQS